MSSKTLRDIGFTLAVLASGVVMLLTVGLWVGALPLTRPGFIQPVPPVHEPYVPKIVVLHFSSPYCGPCREQRGRYEKLHGKHKRCDYKDVNVSEDHATPGEYNVTRVPAYIVTIDGKETFRSASVDELGDYLNHVDEWLDK